jgi:hypothetical protein
MNRSRYRVASAATGAIFAAIALLAISVLWLGLAAKASARPAPPADLQVEGGEEAWHPTRSFRVVWRNPAPSAGAPIAAVRYRVLDPAGTVAIGATRIGWPATSVEGLEVPGPPGAYTVEIWLEDAAGEVGAPAAAKLRFDDRRPGAVVPFVAATWIGRTAFPLMARLGHPDGELPVAGIRGYAVSVAPTPDGSPCDAADRCTEAETDLRGGVEEDSYLVSNLPEGTSYLRALAVSGSGMASPIAREAILQVDKTSPLVWLEGLPDGWTNQPVRLTAEAADGGSGMSFRAGGIPPYTAIAVDDGTPVTAPGDSVSSSVIGEGLHRISYYARDLAGNVDDGGGGNGLPNPPPRTALVRIDREPPVVSFANAQNPMDPELIRASVADPMSGPEAGRGWIGVRRRGSGDPFVPLPAAPAPNGELRARWDSDAYASGEYELRAVGYDLAGNATSTTRRANGEAMVLSSPLKAATTLDAGFWGGSSSQPQTVAFGRGASFSGRLGEGASGELTGMPIQIVERFAGGTGLPDRVTTVITEAGGAFGILLSPGPSREVTAVFHGTPTLARATSPSVLLRVRSGVRLRVSNSVAKIGGPPLIFRGRIGAAPATIPAGGKSVQLQFRLPGLPWSEFRTIQTDWRGRFRYAYRFSDDDSRGVRFQFRAYAPAQGNWPYEPAGSRPVAVRGR